MVRQHQLRQTDFRRGRHLGTKDHVVAWVRPQRPAWMDKATYAAMPETLVLREARVDGLTLVTMTLVILVSQTKKPAGSGLFTAFIIAYLDGQAASPGTLLARVMNPLNGPITLMASSFGPSNFKLPNIMAVAGFMSDFQSWVVACIW